MIRIIFKDGSISQLDNIEKIYIEEGDYEKQTIVGNLAPIEFADDTVKNAIEDLIIDTEGEY